MIRIQWEGCPEEYRRVGELLLPYLPGEGERTIRFEPGEGLRVERRGAAFLIACDTRSAFARGLSFACGQERALPLRERCRVSSLGATLDCSRNAVPTPAALREWLAALALMGYNRAFLYMEDTYTVPELPQFGHFRGRFTPEELREADDFADALGIELIPLIQTLGHLNRAIRQGLGVATDTGDILLVDEEETYALLERMIVAASAPFRTKRIHIGMDEAYQLGRGRYLDLHGYEEPERLMLRHLQRVKEILDRHGLRGIMWSDMFFHMASHSGGSYPRDSVLTPAIRAAVPQGIQQVYWDYYTEDLEYHLDILRKHRELTEDVAFAGGAFTWLGPAPDIQKTLRVGRIDLEACAKSGVDQVYVTTWGDDGAEGDLIFGGLMGWQLFAEGCWHENMEDDWLDARLAACAGCDPAAYRALDALNQLPGVRAGKDDTINPLRQLLWQDPLLPRFAADYAGVPLAAHYAGAAERMEAYAAGGDRYALLWRWYAALAQAVSRKCAAMDGMEAAYAAGDREGMGAVIDQMDEAISAMDAAAEAWQEAWMARKKPFGFEVIDQRLGGAARRLKTARHRLTRWAAGEETSLPELEAPRRLFVRREDGSVGQMNDWQGMISVSGI